METFYKLAGKIIEYYRKEKQKEEGSSFTVKKFCEDICSFPTYKKIASGCEATNEGFYFVLSSKLGVRFEALDLSDENFFCDFAKHFCEVTRNEEKRKHFCNYYEQFFKAHKDCLVYRELYACICMVKGNVEEEQLQYVDALISVCVNPTLIDCLTQMRRQFLNC